jgi:hypothetical protein
MQIKVGKTDRKTGNFDCFLLFLIKVNLDKVRAKQIRERERERERETKPFIFVKVKFLNKSMIIMNEREREREFQYDLIALYKVSVGLTEHCSRDCIETKQTTTDDVDVRQLNNKQDHRLWLTHPYTHTHTLTKNSRCFGQGQRSSGHLTSPTRQLDRLESRSQLESDYFFFCFFFFFFRLLCTIFDRTSDCLPR